METAIIRNDEDMSGEVYTIGKHSCFGCQKIIGDQFLSKVLDKIWHDDCIRCFTCQKLLREKCFSRDYKLYCRDDFYRTFGVKCSGCEDSIYPSDLVRRISNQIFHLSCLKCNQCSLEATTGDQIYLLDDGRFLCTKDYEIFAATVEEVKLNEERPSPLSLGQLHHDIQNQLTYPLNPTPPTTNINNSNTPNNHHNKSTTDHNNQGDGVSDDEDDANKRRGPRTTIKAKQLELLKAAFIATPKPSRHIREKLAADTGLTMRVIQVWFQNRRSKERRVKQLSVSDPSRRNFRKGSIEKERTPVDLNYPFFQSPGSSTGGMDDFPQRTNFNFDMYQQQQQQQHLGTTPTPTNEQVSINTISQDSAIGNGPAPQFSTAQTSGNEANARTTAMPSPTGSLVGQESNNPQTPFSRSESSVNPNEFTMLDSFNGPKPPQNGPVVSSSSSDFNAFNNVGPSFSGNNQTPVSNY